MVVYLDNEILGKEEKEKVIELLKYEANYDAVVNNADIEVFGDLDGDYELVHYNSRETLLVCYDGDYYTCKHYSVIIAKTGEEFDECDSIEEARDIIEAFEEDGNYYEIYDNYAEERVE